MTEPYREESKKNYRSNQNDNATIEQINAGSLQRIADATEKMCLDREELERKLRFMKMRRDLHIHDCERLERSNAALRGVVTKLKRQIAEMKGQNNDS